MNRTETTEEKEWREASHPRLVKRLEDQRTALADLNRQVQSLTAERDNALVKCAELEAGLVKSDRLCVELYTAIYWLNEALASQSKAEGGQQ